MNGFVLGMVMLASSAGVSPVVKTPRATIVPAAFTFDLPDAAAMPPFSRRQLTTVKRFNKTDRFIAVAAGVSLGWVMGGRIGWAATSKSNSADDMSGFRGVIIGAPLGAVVGAVVGYRLTK